MKISERCNKQIEDIERIANKFKTSNKFEPYQVVMWDRDFECISELYLAYKSLEAENKNLKENFTEHLNALEAENERLKDVITQMEKAKAVREENFRYLEAENERLKDQVAQLHTIKKSFEVLRALYLGDYENDDEPF